MKTEKRILALLMAVCLTLGAVTCCHSNDEA